MNVLSPSSLSKGERVSFPSRRPRAANRVRRRTQSLGLYLYLLGYASARTPMTHAPARHGADSGERSKQSRTRTAKRSQGRAGQGKSNRTEQRAGCQAQAARRVLSGQIGSETGRRATVTSRRVDRPARSWAGLPTLALATRRGPCGRRRRTRNRREKIYELGACTTTALLVRLIFPWGRGRRPALTAHLIGGAHVHTSLICDCEPQPTTVEWRV